jgi:hypothetical protein
MSPVAVQLSVADSAPNALDPGVKSVPQATVIGPGTDREGAVLSSNVTTWVAVVELPQMSVAVNVRVTVRPPAVHAALGSEFETVTVASGKQPASTAVAMVVGIVPLQGIVTAAGTDVKTGGVESNPSPAWPKGKVTV